KLTPTACSVLELAPLERGLDLGNDPRLGSHSPASVRSSATRRSAAPSGGGGSPSSLPLEPPPAERDRHRCATARLRRARPCTRLHVPTRTRSGDSIAACVARCSICRAISQPCR